MQIQEGSIQANTGTSVGNGHVQEVVRQAHDELRQLMQQRAEVMRRIGTIKQPIAGLARDVCARLEQKAPPMLARHKDPMASVTTVLNRLVAYGEAKAVALDNGRRAWRWVSDGSDDSQPGSAAQALPAW